MGGGYPSQSLPTRQNVHAFLERILHRRALLIFLQVGAGTVNETMVMLLFWYQFYALKLSAENFLALSLNVNNLCDCDVNLVNKGNCIVM